MRIMLRRTIRTQMSDAFAILDSDQKDADGQLVRLGKLDLHYDPEAIFGTLLLWSDFTKQWSADTLQSVIDEIIGEATLGVGISTDYSIEFFSPPLDSYAYYCNDEDIDPYDLFDGEGEN